MIRRSHCPHPVRTSAPLLGILIAAVSALALGQQMSPSWTWAAEKLARSPHRQEWVTINNGSRTLSGWVVYPDAKGKVPVVLVLHEVVGLTDSTRNTATEIAEMGYIAITPDMLSGLGPNGGSGSFTPRQKNSDALTSRPDNSVNSDLDSWADYGLQLPEANGRFALVGLSWGGGAAFRYAATSKRSELRGVFVFYDIGPPAATQKYDGEPASIPVSGIQVPVYGFYGSTDTRATSSIPATKNAMVAADKFYEPVIYEGADHAFMRMGEMPNASQANTDALGSSLARLKKLLKGLLGDGSATQLKEKR